MGERERQKIPVGVLLDCVPDSAEVLCPLKFPAVPLMSPASALVTHRASLVRLTRGVDHQMPRAMFARSDIAHLLHARPLKVVLTRESRETHGQAAARHVAD